MSRCLGHRRQVRRSAYLRYAPLPGLLATPARKPTTHRHGRARASAALAASGRRLHTDPDALIRDLVEPLARQLATEVARLVRAGAPLGTSVPCSARETPEGA